MPKNQYTESYSHLAEIYDRLMDHVDYRVWRRYVRSLFGFSQIKVKRILDLSCGTGNFITNRSFNRHQYFGVDLSMAMLRQANDKYLLRKIPLINANAQMIPFKDNSFQIVVFLYDSINYILQIQSLNACFTEMNRILSPGGLFIFDTVTEYQCKKYFTDLKQSEFWGNKGYYRHSYFRENDRLQINDFQIILGKKKYFERHVQKIYTSAELKTAAQTANFEFYADYADFTLQKPAENSERIHYICRKESE